MTLKSEIGNGYIDGNGLVAPSKTSGVGSGSDNGPMFTAEFLCLLEQNGEMTPTLAANYMLKFASCFQIDGLLQRTPGVDNRQEGPDDYVGLAAGLCVINRWIQLPFHQTLATSVLLYGLKHFGCFNNERPGKFSLAAFLWRQPQLIGAFLAAASKPTWLSKAAFKIIGQPFFLCAAISIAVSCRGTPVSDTDARRLSWLLIQSTAPASWMCRWAAKGWYERLYNDFERGMKDVAVVYYQAGHPFSKYWKDGYPGEEFP